MNATEMCRPNALRLDHARAPLWENIARFRASLKAPLYCPGHKGGRSLPPELCESLGAIDLNNLPDTDTLHCPTGAIRDAESLLADSYGVTRSFMMVGGSSLGNMAAVMSVAAPGDTVLVQRNAHKSVVAGLIHAGAIPSWIAPEWDARFGVSHGVSLESLRSAIRQHPNARAVLILNPTYFGVVADISALADACHEAEMVLIADEAHGSHFHFGADYPLAAEDAGADLVVQSTHKTLSGLSQAAVLHLCGSRVDVSRIRAALQALQTTSPNFAIMASIDLARRQIVQEGHEQLERLLRLAESARTAINRIAGCRVLEASHASGSETGFQNLDRSKILIDVSHTGWTGGDAQRFLNRHCGVQPELSGPDYLLCILTLGTTAADIEHLVAGLELMVGTRPPLHDEHSGLRELAGRRSQQIPEMVMPPRDAFYAPQSCVPFCQAAGRVSGEIITPYPPGIPVVMPGEKLDVETMELLSAVRDSRSPISAVDPLLTTIRVVA